MNRWALCLWVLIVPLVLVGCATRGANSNGRANEVAHDRIGLTVESWVIRDRDNSLAAALAQIDTPPSWIDGESVALWRANGLRVLAIPVDQIAALRASLPSGGPTEIRELGEATGWTPIATGPDLADHVLRLDSGLLEVGPGQIRLLARSWIEPAIESGDDATRRVVSRVRIELVPQHIEPLARRSPLQIEQDRRPTAVDRGMVFDRLMLSVLAGGTDAIILVGESPRVDWGELAPQSEPEPPDGSTDEDIEDPPEPDDRVEFPLTGPSIRPTLGEAMLNASSYAAGSSPLRVVVVLIPSPSAGFALLQP